MNVTEITTVEAQQEENQNEQQDDRFQAMNARFETMETHIKSLTDLVGSLIDNNNKRKYDEENNEKRRKKARTYVERQNLPQSSKRHEVSEISEDDEISVVTRPYGISDREQPDDVVSTPDQRTMRQQVQDLCGEVNNDQALADDLDPILDPIRKEYEAKVQLGSPLKNTKLATIVNNLYSETMEDEKLKNLLKKYNKPKNCPYVFAPKCNPEIWNKNLTAVHKGHDIGLQKI